MKPTDFFKYLVIDSYSATPKYLQLSDSIISAIEKGHLKKDDALPSINELNYILEISRDTAEKGYKHLKKLDIIVSVPGKGYFVGNEHFKKTIKIFLLFNKLSAHKKIIYDSFVAALGNDAAIDFYIYNNDFTIFKKLIQNCHTDYSYYIIVPHFLEGGTNAYEIINTIPKDKLILLDKKLPGVDGKYSVIYENFEKDIYGALSQVKEELSKYHTLKIVFPKKSYFPKEIIYGFRRFCQQYAFNHFIISDVKLDPIQNGEVYINLMEDDLVILIERIVSLNLVLGKDVGLISYNETPLKRLILNGITTISTDFKMMGIKAAELIKSNKIEQIEMPFYLNLRPSI